MSSLLFNQEALLKRVREPMTLLWVDSNNWGQGVLEEEFREFGVIVVPTLNKEGALEWLEQNEDLRNSPHLRIVTNQRRPGEGDVAGNDFIDELRRRGWNNAMMVYCGYQSYAKNRLVRPDILCSALEDALRDFVLLGLPGVAPPPLGARAIEETRVHYVTLPIDVTADIFQGEDAVNASWGAQSAFSAVPGGGSAPTSPSSMAAFHPLAPPAAVNTLRFVVCSDTHGVDPASIPFCDYLIHGGDFTVEGTKEEVEVFCRWIEQVEGRVRYGIICVQGNHETDESILPPTVGQKCIYLADRQITLAGGITLYGSAWHGQDADGGVAGYSKIPENIDILLTHQPPTDYLDVIFTGDSVGNSHLQSIVEAQRPLLHIFGHNHEGYFAVRNLSTVFIAAAMCQGAGGDLELERRPPIVFDLPVPRRRGGGEKMTLVPLTNGQTRADVDFDAALISTGTTKINP